MDFVCKLYGNTYAVHVTHWRVQGGALGAEAPRTRGPGKKKKRRKREREGKKRRKRRKERNPMIIKKIFQPPIPAKWISNIPPWVHSSDAPTILGVCVWVGDPFPPQK